MLIICKNCSNKFNISKYGFVCNSCNYLNPIIQDIDYFLYLAIPCSLEINKPLLETNYITRMMIYHPDKYINKTEEEQYFAMIHSSYLNTAYSTLNNEIDTIAYLYKMYNKEDIITEEKLLYDNSLMIEFFDLYEQMHQVTIENKKDFIDKLINIKTELIDKIKTLNFAKEAKEIQTFYIKIRYLNRVQEKLLERLSSN